MRRYQNKTMKRYSEGHRDDCVHLGDAGNILLQDMVGGLVNHLSNLNKRFDLADLMNQTVGYPVTWPGSNLFQEWDDWREAEFGKFENIKRFRVTNWVPSVQRGSVGSSNEVKTKINRRSNSSTNQQSSESTIPRSPDIILVNIIPDKITNRTNQVEVRNPSEGSKIRPRSHDLGQESTDDTRPQ